MWEEYEDQVTRVLAAEAGTAPTPAMRLRAIGVIGLLRGLTSPEMRAALAGLPPPDALAYVCDWLLAAAQAGTSSRGSSRTDTRSAPRCGPWPGPPSATGTAAPDASSTNATGLSSTART
jgi:hypothetical protein